MDENSSQADSPLALEQELTALERQVEEIRKRMFEADRTRSQIQPSSNYYLS